MLLLESFCVSFVFLLFRQNLWVVASNLTHPCAAQMAGLTSGAVLSTLERVSALSMSGRRGLLGGLGTS